MQSCGQTKHILKHFPPSRAVKINNSLSPSSSWSTTNSTAQKPRRPTVRWYSCKICSNVTDTTAIPKESIIWNPISSWISALTSFNMSIPLPISLIRKAKLWQDNSQEIRSAGKMNVRTKDQMVKKNWEWASMESLLLIKIKREKKWE